MKKILALVLAALMLLSFVSCGVEETVNNVVDNVVSDIAEESNKAITRGVVSGSTYTSEYSGISFTAPEGWSYATDAEIASMMNTSVDAIDLSDLEKTIAENGTVYDMMVTDAATASNVIVLYENLEITNAGQSITAQQYLDVLKTQLPQQSGMDYNFMAEETVTLSGNEYLKGTFSLTVETAIISQVYYLRLIDNIMCCMIVTPVNGVSVEDIEAMFI